jgi:hypothetical protein
LQVLRDFRSRYFIGRHPQAPNCEARATAPGGALRRSPAKTPGSSLRAASPTSPNGLKIRPSGTTKCSKRPDAESLGSGLVQTADHSANGLPVVTWSFLDAPSGDLSRHWHSSCSRERVSREGPRTSDSLNALSPNGVGHDRIDCSPPPASGNRLAAVGRSLHCPTLPGSAVAGPLQPDGVRYARALFAAGRPASPKRGQGPLGPAAAGDQPASSAIGSSQAKN